MKVLDLVSLLFETVHRCWVNEALASLLVLATSITRQDAGVGDHSSHLRRLSLSSCGARSLAIAEVNLCCALLSCLARLDQLILGLAVELGVTGRVLQNLKRSLGRRIRHALPRIVSLLLYSILVSRLEHLLDQSLSLRLFLYYLDVESWDPICVGLFIVLPCSH